MEQKWFVLTMEYSDGTEKTVEFRSTPQFSLQTLTERPSRWFEINGRYYNADHIRSFRLEEKEMKIKRERKKNELTEELKRQLDLWNL